MMYTQYMSLRVVCVCCDDNRNNLTLSHRQKCETVVAVHTQMDICCMST